MKVHLRLNGTKGLCGADPLRGANVRTCATFWHEPEGDQCGRCVTQFERRGFSMKKARMTAKIQPTPTGVRVIEDRKPAEYWWNKL